MTDVQGRFRQRYSDRNLKELLHLDVARRQRSQKQWPNVTGTPRERQVGKNDLNYQLHQRKKVNIKVELLPLGMHIA